MTTSTGVKIGDIVTYHGSITHEHGTVCYIRDVEPSGRYTLVDRDYPTVTVMRHVRRVSFTPTGGHINLCLCGHDAHRASTIGTCAAITCDCPLAHDNEEA